MSNPTDDALRAATPTLQDRINIYATMAREAAAAGRDIDASFGLIQVLDSAKDQIDRLTAACREKDEQLKRITRAAVQQSIRVREKDKEPWTVKQLRDHRDRLTERCDLLLDLVGKLEELIRRCTPHKMLTSDMTALFHEIHGCDPKTGRKLPTDASDCRTCKGTGLVETGTVFRGMVECVPCDDCTDASDAPSMGDPNANP